MKTTEDLKAQALKAILDGITKHAFIHSFPQTSMHPKARKAYEAATKEHGCCPNDWNGSDYVGTKGIVRTAYEGDDRTVYCFTSSMVLKWEVTFKGAPGTLFDQAMVEASRESGVK